MLRKNKDTSVEPKTSEGLSQRGGALDPFGWFDDMDRWFEDVRREFGRAWGSWPLSETALAPFAWARAPALDIRDDGGELVVTADLPGVSKEGLEIEATPETLEIQAEANREREESDPKYVYRERTYSGFHRILPLPAQVDPEKVAATLNNGVLEIRLPKREPAPAPKSVKVKVQ